MEPEQQANNPRKGLGQKIKGLPRWLKWTLCLVLLLAVGAAVAL